MICFIGTNDVGQIISKSFCSLKGNEESYQDFLNRINSEINYDPREQNLKAIDFSYIGENAKDEIKNIDHNQTNEILKDHNTIEVLSMMIGDEGDPDLIASMAKFREGSILKPIKKMRKLVGRDIINDISLEKLLSIFKIFTCN